MVGAEGYEHYSKLDYACDDARDVAKTLVERYRFEPDTVRVLTDDGDPLQTPTAGHILGELETFLADKRLDKGDLFVFFFAGHGVGTPDGDYLLPTDARPASVKAVGVPVATLIKRFVDRGLKNVLIVADACRNGTENPFGEELQRLGREANLAVMLGSSPGSRSYEDKRLKHGVFAYQLLKALDDPKLRNPISGALWASTVGKTVRDATVEYTERDYGDAAQRPAVWASATEDVLLGAFVPDTIDAATVAAFREQAQTLDSASFVAAMTEYGAQLLTVGRPADAIEIFRAAEPIGLSPLGTYLLGLSFYLTERQIEATKRLRAVWTEDPKSYYGSLAASFDPDLSFDVRERVAAAKRVLALGQDEVSAFTAWSVLKQYGVTKEKLELLAAADAVPGLSQRFKHYFAGERALLENRFDDALASFGQVADRTDFRDEEPSPFLGALLKSQLMDSLGKRPERAKYIETLVERKETGQGTWLLARAELRRAAGDRPGALEDVRQALGTQLDPDDILRALRLLGTDAQEVAALASEAAKKVPYSWKARLAASLAEAMKGGAEALGTAFAEAEQYAPDQVGLRVEFVELFDAFLNDGFEQGIVPPAVYGQFIEGAFLMLDEVRAGFPLGYYAWWPYARVGSVMERQLQVARAATARFDTLLDDGSLPLGLLDVLAIVYTGVGDTARLDKVEKLAIAAGPLATDAVRQIAYFHAIQHRPEQARALLAKLPVYPGNEGLGDALLRAYLDAQDGKSEAAAKAAEAQEPVEGYARALKGLVLWTAGRKDEAKPLLEESRQERSWGYPFVHLETMRILAEEAKATRDNEKLDALAYEASISQPGNPLIAAFAFAGAGQGKFAGSAEFKVSTRDDDLDVSQGTLTLSVDAKDQVRGVFEGADGKIRAVSGTVDAHGNVQGAARADGKSLPLYGKIPPMSRVGEIAQLKQPGLIFILLDENGRRTVWVARPSTPQQGAEEGSAFLKSSFRPKRLPTGSPQGRPRICQAISDLSNR